MAVDEPLDEFVVGWSGADGRAGRRVWPGRGGADDLGRPAMDAPDMGDDVAHGPAGQVSHRRVEIGRCGRGASAVPSA